MKYILILVLVLIPVCSYAGCDELKAAILNIEKAIEQQSVVIAEPITDSSSYRRRISAKKDIEELVVLRQTLSEQQCSQGGRDIPVTAAKPVAPAAAKPAQTQTPSKLVDDKRGKDGGKFKPAGKMY
jgi:hypothetical protein